MREALRISIISLIFCAISPITGCNATQNFTPNYQQVIDCDLEGEALRENLDTIRMTKYDSAIIIAISPFSILASLFVIVTSFYYPKLLEQPGDIILALAFNELLKIIVFLVNAIYYYSNEVGPHDRTSFCQLTGSFLMLSQYIEDYYNLIFCIFILLKIRYLLKEIKIPPIIYHSFLIIMMSTMVVLLKYYGRIGKNYNGICGLKACFNPWGAAVDFIQVVNIFLVALTLRYFIKRLPSYTNIRKIKAEIINYLGIYLIGQTVARLVYELFFVMLQTNSYEWKSESFRSFQFLVHLKLFITPLLLLIMRYNHLFMSEIFKKIFFCRAFFFKYILGQEDPPASVDLQKSLNTSYIPGSPTHCSKSVGPFPYTEDQLNPRSKTIASPGKPGKMSLEVESFPIKKTTLGSKDKPRGSEKAEVGFFTINIISYNMKVMLTRSILTGIWISHTMPEVPQEEKPGFWQRRESKRNANIFLETKRVPIENNAAEESKSLFELTMTIYAPRMFKRLLNFDKDMIDFDLSLDLTRNDENIKKANKTDGGKSGQFFFFTHDNKLIIKTLSSQELQIFLKSFEEYYNYFMKHKDSLITKIYGVYTFARKDLDISNHVIIMRNIVNTSKKNFIVAYDLKGSTFDREVLRDLHSFEDREEAYARKSTLKDCDFLKFERNISIPAFMKDRLLKNLEGDTVFLRKMGFMDYSLFLVKVRKVKGIGLLAELKQNPSNPLYSIESLTEPGVFYNIGIIDYFQKYTLGKYFEKIVKKVVHADSGLDTSSQDPKTYAERFLTFMRVIVK